MSIKNLLILVCCFVVLTLFIGCGLFSKDSDTSNSNSETKLDFSNDCSTIQAASEQKQCETNNHAQAMNHLYDILKNN